MSILARISVSAIFFSLIASQASAETRPVSINLLHTNDLHSHFRADKDELALGGVARLKTAIDQVRGLNPNTLVLDAGDWSEGEIYYAAGGGTQSLRMMDHLGYDVAVVGNHDWFNGPDALVNSYNEARPRMQLVSANLDTRNYSRKDEFEAIVHPYVFRDIGGIRIAFIGASTFEFIYDRFLVPVRVLSPFSIIKELSSRLRREADLIVVISHNNLKINQGLLSAAPEVDLVVSGHQHKILREPVVVQRPGRADGWVVEAGYWGRFLGKVELEVTPGWRFENSVVRLKDYDLVPIDDRYKEDPKTLELVEEMERIIVRKFGENVFDDHVGHSHLEMSYSAAEDYMGNLVTDAYLQATGADFALEHLKFIYQEIHQGPIHSADVFDALPAIYDINSDQTWTLKTIAMEGRRLKWYLNLLYSSRLFMKEQIHHSNAVAASGIDFVFDPLVGSKIISSWNDDLPFPWVETSGSSGLVISDLKIQGVPINESKTYRVAVTNGIIYTAEFINKFLPGAFPIRDVVDTGVEAWRTLRNYIRKITPITSEKVILGNRMRSLQPNLGIYSGDVEFTRTSGNSRSQRGRIRARVRNLGEQASVAGASVRIYTNKHRGDLSKEPEWIEVADAKSLPSLQKGEEAKMGWHVQIPGSEGVYPLKLEIVGSEGESDTSNDYVIRWLR